MLYPRIKTGDAMSIPDQPNHLWTTESGPGKLAIAARLRREITLSIKDIAARVQLGTSKGANKNLHKWMGAKTCENPNQGQFGI